jgi:pSer/pThr/pTyr-binding forkhead associated (FHA) protein
MLGKLVPCGGGIPIQLHKPILVVGRRPECDVTIPSGSVSGRHCELRFSDGFWSVRDLGSKNGIGVNGVRCQEQRLEPKDRLSIGRVRFRISYSAPTDATPGDSSSVEDDLAMQFLQGDDLPTAATSPTAADATVITPEPPTHQPSKPDSQPVTRRPAAAPARTPTPAKRPAREQTAARPETSGAAQKTDTPPRAAKRPGKRFLGKLVPCGGGDPIPLLESPLLIGRASGSDIRVKQPSVSSRHCKLEYRDGFWFVTDLGSSNGIRVDGVSTESSHLLPEAILSVARFRLQIHYTPPEDAIPPDDDILSVSLLEKAGLSKSLKDDKTPNWIIEDEESSPKPRYEIKDSDSADPV